MSIVMLGNPYYSETELGQRADIAGRYLRNIVTPVAVEGVMFPETPPKGTGAALICYPFRFRNKAHELAWREVFFQTVVWSRSDLEIRELPEYVPPIVRQ